MDLQRRMKTNPFYSEAVKMLGRANFHMHRAEYGEAGGIKLYVYVCDRQGKEGTQEFSFPAKMNGLAMMQWKVGFQRNLADLERSGLRPSRQQFEKLPEPKALMPPTEPEVSTVEGVSAKKLQEVSDAISKVKGLPENFVEYDIKKERDIVTEETIEATMRLNDADAIKAILKVIGSPGIKPQTTEKISDILKQVLAVVEED